MNPSFCTGCSLDVLFFEDFKIYSGDSGLSRFPLGVNAKSNTCASAAELAEFRKNHNILRENTILNEHPVLEMARVPAIKEDLAD